MLIKIRYPNHHHSYDFLCFNLHFLKLIVHMALAADSFFIGNSID